MENETRRVHMNHNSHLLELEEYMYPLVDVTRPNTFRNLYPYDEIPKIAFNDRTVPHHMPDQIWITDTTFRDGQQSRAPYTTEQIVTIYDYMHKLGGPKGKIRACEFFLYDEKDRKAVEKCMDRGYRFPQVTSWIRASEEDFKLVRSITSPSSRSALRWVSAPVATLRTLPGLISTATSFLSVSSS